MRPSSTISRLACIACFSLIGFAGSARAGVIFDFSYSYPGVTSSGQFVTDDLGGGTFLVTSATGQRNGVVIAALLPVGTGGYTDNLLFPSLAIPVDFPGVSYLLGDGTQINLYNSQSQHNVREYVNFTTELPVGGAFSLYLTQVPEPLTGSLVAAGILAVFLARSAQRSRRGVLKPRRGSV